MSTPTTSSPLGNEQPAFALGDLGPEPPAQMS
jgi:hypothetical protein